jgi:hypothetical protein
MKLHNLKIEKRNPHDAKFWLDDKQIVGVKSYTIEERVGAGPTATLVIVFESVEILNESAQPSAKMTRTYTRKLDGGIVEHAVNYGVEMEKENIDDMSKTRDG